MKRAQFVIVGLSLILLAVSVVISSTRVADTEYAYQTGVIIGAAAVMQLVNEGAEISVQSIKNRADFIAGRETDWSQ